jgi:glutaredoxin
MLFIGHFSFDEIGKDGDTRHGYFSSIVDADSTDNAVSEFERHIRKMKARAREMMSVVKVYIEEILKIAKLPDSPVVTLLQSADGEFPLSVSYSLPDYRGKGIEALGFTPDVEKQESANGSAVIESEPFITFEGNTDTGPKPVIPTVTIFSLSTCSHCKAVVNLLTRYDIEYEVIEVDKLKGDRRKETIEAVKKFNERVSFPTTVIGDHVVVGYQADQIRNALDR